MLSGPALIDHWFKPRAGILVDIDAARNRLTGFLPEGLFLMTRILSGRLDLADNQLAGTLVSLGMQAHNSGKESLTAGFLYKAGAETTPNT